MRKIPSVFARNYDGDRLLRNEVVRGCEWVLAGEGVATRKWDGTACMVRSGVLFKRFDARPGREVPQGFEPCEARPDEHTGHWPGWMPVGDGPEDRWHREARELNANVGLPDGTYELVGPRINGNNDRAAVHCLCRHARIDYLECPRTFDTLRTWLAEQRVEGVVFHHPDGRMAKVKRSDFGLPWPVAT